MKRLKPTKAFSKHLKPLLAAALIFAILAPSAAAQDIHLKSRTIGPGDSGQLPVEGISGDGSQSTHHLLVQFKDSATRYDRESLEGVELLGYVPEDTWYASVPADRLDELERDSDVKRLVKLKPGDKISESVDSDTSIVEVEVFGDVEDSEVKKALSRHGKIVGKPANNTWRVQDVSLNRLAEEDAVKWIDRLPPKPEHQLENSRSLIKADTVQRDYGLTGSGITAAMWDGGLAGDHRDLDYKKTNGDSYSISDHATHVAGVMLGGGKLNNNYRGMAPDADLVTYEWPTSSTRELYTETADAVSRGAVVSQNSWGWSVGSYSDMGSYGSYSKAYDSIIHGDAGHRPISVVFSAGNEGNDGWPSRYDTITGVGGTAKNSITVGALTDSGRMTSYSSWGPTDDGRIKPDVMANGQAVTSTLPGDNYGSKSGTSISAPAVSGAVILVNQAFKDAHGSLPSPATVKAVLIHTAKDIETEGPDYKSGWGQVNIEKAVDLIQNGQITTGTLDSEGQKKTYSFDASEGGKFTLVWSDAPGESSAGKALVNDLDLVVKDQSGNRYYPYTVDPNNPSSPATQDSEDERNPVEQVVVPSGTGQVTVTVEAEDLPAPSQEFTLVTEETGKNVSNPDPDPALNVTIESPEDKVYNTSPELEVATSEDADVYFSVDDGYWYRMDQNSKTDYTASYDFGDGQHKVEFYAKTADGDHKMKTVEFELQSDSKLDFTVDSPEEKTYQTSGITFQISSNGNLSKAWYELDNGEKGTLDKVSDGTYQTLANLDDGNYTAEIFAEDASGNVESKKVSFEINTGSEKPGDGPRDGPDNGNDTRAEFTVVSPEDKVYNTDSLEFKVKPGEELKRVEYEFDGSRKGMLTEHKGLYTEQVSDMEDGDHKVTFKVEDSKGNTDTETVEFRVDTSEDRPDDPRDGPSDDTKVEFEVRSPESKTYNTDGVQLNIRAGEKLVKAEYSLDGDTGTLNQNGQSYTAMARNLEDGEHTVKFTVEDESGNVETEEVKFRIGTGSDNPDNGPDDPRDGPGDGGNTIGGGDHIFYVTPNQESGKVGVQTESEEAAYVDAVSPDVEKCQTFETPAEVPDGWAVIDEGCNDRKAGLEQPEPDVAKAPSNNGGLLKGLIKLLVDLI